MMIRRAVEEMRRKHPDINAGEMLIYLTLVEHGAVLKLQELLKSIDEWVAKHGRPTWESLEEAMDEMELQHRLGMATIRAFKGEHVQDHSCDS